ncbi:MAG TPA: hypothetical protein VG269_10190 [Tepidisphaeraceae bacterium]|jgi:hypothetical protein|nr:hypothetical protein [Tepidisphaeraceae bacterium]
MTIKRLAYAAWIFTLFLALPVHASIVTLNFAGTVMGPVDYSGLGYVPAGIQSGSAYVGTVTFDNSAPGSTDPTDGFYRGTALAMTVNITIAGQFNYVLDTPSAADEIDLIGSSFGLYKRGPTVYTAFSPNPPFSHIDFGAVCSTDVLSTMVVSPGSSPTSGVSDQQTDAGYYYIGANLDSVSSVPEPGLPSAVMVAATMLLVNCRSSRPAKHSTPSI